MQSDSIISPPVIQDVSDHKCIDCRRLCEKCDSPICVEHGEFYTDEDGFYFCDEDCAKLFYQ